MLGRAKARWVAVDRPWKLMALTLGWVAILWAIDSITNSHLWNNLFYPALSTTPDVQAWSARVYAAIFIVGIPPAFFLWHWRDRNVRDQIIEQRGQVENARNDTNLKGFQEVQLKAAGTYIKDDQSSGIILQNAALYQLRDYLHGSYGTNFVRPAFEMLAALWRAECENRGIFDLKRQIATHRERGLAPFSIGSFEDADLLRSSLSKIRAHLEGRERQGSVYSILCEDFVYILNSEIPFHLSGFQCLDVQKGSKIKDLKLESMDFFSTSFRSCDFSGSNLKGCCFDFCDLSDAIFDNCNLHGATFIGARLDGTSFKNTDLSKVIFDGTNIKNVDFSDAELTSVSFVGSDIHAVQFERCNGMPMYMSGARLNSCKFNNAQLGTVTGETGAPWATKFDYADLSNCGFEKACLFEVWFVRTRLKFVRFSGSDLRKTNFSNKIDWKTIRNDNVTFDESTKFGWSEFTRLLDANLDEWKTKFEESGAINLDKVPENMRRLYL